METRFRITEWVSKLTRSIVIRSANEAYSLFLLFHFYFDFQLKCRTRLKLPMGSLFQTLCRECLKCGITEMSINLAGQLCFLILVVFHFSTF